MYRRGDRHGAPSVLLARCICLADMHTHLNTSSIKHLNNTVLPQHVLQCVAQRLIKWYTLLAAVYNPYVQRLYNVVQLCCYSDGVSDPLVL